MGDLNEDNKPIKARQLTLKEKWSKLTDITDIRIQKTLEMVQYSIVFAMISLVMGLLLEYSFPKDTPETAKERSTGYLLVLIIIQLILAVIMSSYIPRIALMVPFLFQYTDDYIPGLKKEYMTGGAVAISLVFYSSISSLYTRTRELISRTTVALHIER